jgi:fatty acid desaturase
MRASDVVMAFLAVALFAAFLAVLIWKVPSPPLILVCLLGVALAAFDFIQTGVRHRTTRRGSNRPPL